MQKPADHTGAGSAFAGWRGRAGLLRATRRGINSALIRKN